MCWCVGAARAQVQCSTPPWFLAGECVCAAPRARWEGCGVAAAVGAGSLIECCVPAARRRRSARSALIGRKGPRGARPGMRLGGYAASQRPKCGRRDPPARALGRIECKGRGPRRQRAAAAMRPSLGAREAEQAPRAGRAAPARGTPEGCGQRGGRMQRRGRAPPAPSAVLRTPNRAPARGRRRRGRGEGRARGCGARAHAGGSCMTGNRQACGCAEPGGGPARLLSGYMDQERPRGSGQRGAPGASGRALRRSPPGLSLLRDFPRRAAIPQGSCPLQMGVRGRRRPGNGFRGPQTRGLLVPIISDIPPGLTQGSA